MNTVLKRDTFTPTATFGAFFGEATGERICETVEQVRDNNRASTKERPGACIPAGVYTCRRIVSPKFGDCFEVTNVQGRSHILIHSANWSSQLRGCISPGTTRAVIDDNNPDTLDDRGVASSKKALDKFMQLQKGIDTFYLTIIDAA